MSSDQPLLGRGLRRGVVRLAAGFIALISTALIAQLLLTRGEEPRRAQLSSRSASGGLGVSLGLFASDPLWDYEELIQEIAELGVSRVMIVTPLIQGSHRDDAPQLGPPLEVIRRSVQQARAEGLEVSLMPIIQLKRRSMNMWRGRLDPRRPALWWSNYRAELKRLASLAEQESVERLVIGAELCSLEAQTERWRELIQGLRARFKGALTYSANWDHYRELPFWEELDELSVTAYFPIQSREDLERDWAAALDELERFAATRGDAGMPLYLTEYGYPALASALARPWDETTSAAYDAELQAELVTRATSLLLTRMSERGALRGASLWNWFGFGGRRDRGYTLRDRPGQEALRALIKAHKSAEARAPQRAPLFGTSEAAAQAE